MNKYTWEDDEIVIFEPIKVNTSLIFIDECSKQQT